MKRILSLSLIIILAFTFSACTGEYEQADEYAKDFISALCLGNAEKMAAYTHPDYTESALPDEEFYKALETQFFTVGNEMTALNGVGKARIEEDDAFPDGDVLKCTYVARVNELFYTVELIMLDNDNGYGVVSVAMVLNTELDYYYRGEE